MAEPQQPKRNLERWQPRFGLRSLLLMMFVFSVMSTSGFYLVRALDQGRAEQFGFILFTLAAPLLLAIAISLFLAAARFLRR